MAAEGFHQFGHIYITLESVGYLETAGAVLFQTGLYLAEGGGKLIKGLDVIVFQNFGSHETHHGPYFGHGIGNRSTGSQYHITAAVAFLYIRYFQIQAVGTFTVTGINTLHVLHLRAETNLLEVMGFVNEQGVDTHLFKGQYIIGPAVQLTYFFGCGAFFLLGLFLHVQFTAFDFTGIGFIIAQRKFHSLGFALQSVSQTSV